MSTCLLKHPHLEWLDNKIILFISEIQPYREEKYMAGLFFLESFMRFMKALWILKHHINYSRESQALSYLCWLRENEAWGVLHCFWIWSSFLPRTRFTLNRSPGSSVGLSHSWPSSGEQKENLGLSVGLFNFSSCRGSCRISGLIWSVRKELLQSHFQRGNVLFAPLLCQHDNSTFSSLRRHFSLPGVWFNPGSTETWRASHPGCRQAVGEQVQGC